MEKMIETLEFLKVAFQVIVLGLAIAALVVGRNEQIRNTRDLAAIMSLVVQSNAAADGAPVPVASQDDETSAQ